MSRMSAADALASALAKHLVANAEAMVAFVPGQPKLHLGVATLDGGWSAATDGDLGAISHRQARAQG